MTDAAELASEGERVLASRVGTYLKAAEQALMATKTRALRPFGLTVPQYIALTSLYYLPGQSAAQLARTALLTPQTMATILGNLEAKGLIERQHSQLHVRVLVTTLTPQGEELVLRADGAVRRVEDALSKAFDETARAGLVSGLIHATEVLRGVEAELDDE
ncbi:MAG: MarR family winged helix-turn-helix transcriptional regulator [Beutenbergiaceae bacterium]